MKKYIIFVLVLVVLFSSRFSNATKPSDYGLKEGDLISAIFSDDPDVYIINEQGYKRLFLNPEIFKFYSHLGGFANIKLVTPEIRDSFPTSGFFRNCEDNDQKVFGTSVEGEDTGRLHWINKSGDQAVQEDPDFFKKVFCINRKEFNWYPRGNEFRALKEVPQYSRTAEVENPVICHYPVDNPKNPQTIRVAPESLDAHFQHGDTKGACPGFLVPTLKPEIVTPTPTPTTMVYLIQPMVLKDILKIESVTPYDVANLSFGVYQVSAQYNLGAYHQGKWYEGLNPGISGPVWIEFGWPNMPQVDIVLLDENGQQRKIYLPATGSNKNPDGSSSNWYYWISEDGSSYYGRKDHNFGWPDLSSIEALRPEHLARKAGASIPTSTSTPTPTSISNTTYDLAVVDVIPNPVTPEANKDFTVDVVFKNVGQKSITNPTAGLNIYDPNGKIIYSPATGSPSIVNPGATITVKFYSDMFSPRSTETTLNYPAGIYKMVGNINYLGTVDGVNYPKDPNPTNDTFTKMLEIKSTLTPTPTPTPTSTLTSQSVTVITPNGGECMAGIFPITWSSSLGSEVANWRLNYSLDNGSSWWYVMYLHNSGARSHNYWASGDVVNRTDLDSGQVTMRVQAYGPTFPGGTLLGSDVSDKVFSVRPSCPGGTVSSVPSNLIATPKTYSTGTQSILLNWTDNSNNELGFASYKRVLGDSKWDNPIYVSGTSLEYQGLQSGTTYEFKVRSGNQYGYSSEVKITAIAGTSTSTPTPTPAPTPIPIPTPTTLTIRGKMVNAITNQPVTSTNMLIWNWKGSTRRDFYLKSDGTFEIQLTEDDIANASITYVNNVHINSQACYDQSQFSIQKTSTGSVDYVRVQGPGGNYSGISTRTVQPINNVADIGDFLVWPVTGFSLVSDIPVKFTSKFANGSGGGGNSLYKTSHGFSTLYPINTGTSIILTDQSGKQYSSPYVKYSLGQHCSQVNLNFTSVASSQFSWSPPGETAVANPNSSFVLNTFTRDLYFGLTGNDVKQLQALLVNEVGYSADLITGYFGRITRDAVKKLQEKYGIKPTYGYFGEITRKAISALISN